jgi:ATP-dependent helicase/nuclease subunit A
VALQWRYGFEEATRRAAKTSVSALRRALAEEEDDESELLFTPPPDFPGERRSGPLPAAETVAARQRRPAGEGRGGALSAAETGSAHHAFLERVALAETGSVAGLRAEAARMQREGSLSEAQAACLDFQALAAFWQSEAGRQLLARREDVRREVAFTARFSPWELEELPGRGGELEQQASQLVDEFVIVQGVMDLAVVTPEEIWVLDFKTDHFAEQELEAKVRQYRPQLTLYARAIARIYGLPVTRRWLHFFAVGRTVELDGE